MDENNGNIKEMLDSVLSGLKGMSGVESIIGDAITAPDGTVIIPVSKLTFGFGGGGNDAKETSKKPTNSFGGGFGGGAAVTPITFLVISNGNVRLMPIGGSQSSADKIIDMVPGIVDKVNGFMADRKANKQQ